MSTWARNVHRQAATLGNAMFRHSNSVPSRQLEKVKFGVELNKLCHKGIPGPLLILILKLNKEAPSSKDVFRAPGYESDVKKLIHSLETGRLINVDNYSVNTIASVLKKLFRKLPSGVFGDAGEERLFASVDFPEKERDDEIREVLKTLPVTSQQLLVLLFGTFRVVATYAEKYNTGMTSEALGVSVAPSFFHSCVSDRKRARMDDIQRYKVASRVMRQMIDQFSSGDLFGRENYEYYTRLTGRILYVNDEWVCSFSQPLMPPDPDAQEAFAKKLSLVPDKTWLQCESDRLGNKSNMEGRAKPEEYHSVPGLSDVVGGNTAGTVLNLGVIPEHRLLDSCTRLSISLEESIFKISVSSSSQSSRSNSSPLLNREDLRALNKYAESTKSLTYLPQVGSDAARGAGPSGLEYAGAPPPPPPSPPPGAAAGRTPMRRSRSLSSLVK